MHGMLSQGGASVMKGGRVPFSSPKAAVTPGLRLKRAAVHIATQDMTPWTLTTGTTVNVPCWPSDSTPARPRLLQGCGVSQSVCFHATLHAAGLHAS